MNLLIETIEVMQENGKTPDDVKFVGSSDGSTGWNQFADFAKDFNYDNGFGGNEVSMEIKVVGVDWWLERHEYDGSEWWEYKTLPVRVENAIEINNLVPKQYKDLD